VKEVKNSLKSFLDETLFIMQ